jgi:alpha-tubulin suppressor-like RCC1 family protein
MEDSSIPIAVTESIDGIDLRFSSISAGAFHTCGVAVTGIAYCWGSIKENGFLNESSDNSSVPVAVSLPKSGKPLSFSSISAGQFYTCGVTTDHLGYCWGLNEDKQLGNQSEENSGVPVAVSAPKGGKPLGFLSISASEFHTCAVALNGKAYCWGDNVVGQLGDNSKPIKEFRSSSIPVAVALPKVEKSLIFSSITTGSHHTCGVNINLVAYCWGSNGKSQLGNNGTNSRLPVLVAAPKGEKPLTFSNISAGEGYTCGVALNGKTYCWGANKVGQFGNNSKIGSKVPVAINAVLNGETLMFTSIETGDTHTCGLTLNATYCWGVNNYGKLGNNSKTLSVVPVAVVTP